MLTLIKDFTFIDMLSYDSKCNKNKMNIIISNAYESSIHNIDLNAVWYDPNNDPWHNIDDNDIDNDNPDDNDKQWSFWTGNIMDVHFNAVFCGTCGNYYNIHIPLHIPLHIRCNCER